MNVLETGLDYEAGQTELTLGCLAEGGVELVGRGSELATSDVDGAHVDSERGRVELVRQ